MTNSIPLNTMVTLIFVYLVFIHMKRHNSLQNVIKIYYYHRNVNIWWNKSFTNGTSKAILFYLDEKRCTKNHSNGIFAWLCYSNCSTNDCIQFGQQMDLYPVNCIWMTETQQQFIQD
eukprot:85820_1